MGRRPDGATPRGEWVTWRVSAEEAELLNACQGTGSRAAYLRELVRADAERRGLL